MVGEEKRRKGKKSDATVPPHLLRRFFFLRVTGASPPSCQGFGPSEEDILYIVAIVLDVLDVAHLLALIISGSLHSLTLGPIGLVTPFVGDCEKSLKP
jgi:hypothetical protein